MRLILVRHPVPHIASGICYGRSDVAVAPEEMAKISSALQAALPAHVPLYASPLRRCAELASSVARELPASALRFDARLAEMDFGSWEMQPWQAIARAEVDAWAADMVHYRPGGGENVLAMATRVEAFLSDVLCEPHETAVIVCHAGTIRLLCALQARLPLEETALLAASSAHKIAYGAAISLDF